MSFRAGDRIERKVLPPMRATVTYAPDVLEDLMHVRFDGETKKRVVVQRLWQRIDAVTLLARIAP